jgi:hypothetical protein
VRFVPEAAAVYIALILTVVLGGFLNATVGTAGVVAYGVVALGVIIVLAVRRRQAR